MNQQSTQSNMLKMSKGTMMENLAHSERLEKAISVLQGLVAISYVGCVGPWDRAREFLAEYEKEKAAHRGPVD